MVRPKIKREYSRIITMKDEASPKGIPGEAIFKHSNKNIQSQDMSNSSKKPTFTGAANSLKFQYQIGAFIGFTWLAITTGLLIYNNAIEKLPEYFSNPDHAVWGAWVAVVFAYFLLDFGHANNLSIYLDYKDDSKETASDLRLMFVITMIQLAGTTLASLWLAPDAAKFMTKEHDADKYFQMVESNNNFRQGQTATLDSTIQNLKQSQNQREKAAMKRADAIIRNAVNSGDRWQRASYKKEGLNWLSNRLNKDRRDHNYVTTILNARALADSIINAESSIVDNVLKSKQLLLGDTTSKAYVTALLRQENSAHQEHLRKLKKNKNIFIFADIFSLFLAMFSVFMLHKIRLINKEKIDIRSIHLVIAKFFGKKYYDLINFFEKWLGIDINGDGYIGDPEDAVLAVPEQKKTVLETVSGTVLEPSRTVVKAFHNKTVPGTVPAQSQNVVPQQVNNTPPPAKKTVLPPVPETVPEQKKAVPEQVEITRIVIAPQQELEKAIKYAKIYYERSKTSKKEATRNSNRATYEEHKQLIQVSGKYKITEGPDKVVIEEV